MTNTKTLQDAINLAMFAHREQVDKAGQPYTLNLFRVMSNVESYTAKIVAVLHDLVEDTEYTFEELSDLGSGLFKRGYRCFKVPYKEG